MPNLTKKSGTGLGIALGAGMGIVFGESLFDDVGVGLASGAAIGLLAGLFFGGTPAPENQERQDDQVSAPIEVE